MRFGPHEYQKAIIGRILAQKRLALLLDMGTGKTACALFAMRWLMSARLDFEKALIIAPKRVAESTWPDEAAKWDEFRGLRMSLVLGSEAEREAALERDADVYVINRENAVWLIEHYEAKGRKWPFGMLVIDESSSFKNRAAKRWKAAKAMAIATPRVLLLTGTPAPNGLEDLWAQIYLLDQGERLGRTITAFRQRWFHPGAHNGMVVFEYLPNKGAEEQIYKSISDVAISIRAKDVLKMPERIDERIELALPSGIKEISRRLERDYLCEVGKETLTAASAGVVVNKLLQVADGAVYVERPIHTTALVSRDHDCEKIRVDTGGSDSEPWMEIHRLKLEALERIVEDNEGQSILVYYNYRFDRERILKALSDYGPRTLDGPKDVTDWNLGKIKILLANPASSAFGINLQGGGHIIVWITPIWNLELTQQANARLLRQGQEHPVVIYHIVAKGTEDEEVEKALERKAVTQDDLIKAVRARIREAGGNGNA